MWSTFSNGPFPGTFAISNRLKQGAILSAILFGIYMNEFLNRLKNAYVGCYIDKMLLDWFQYADDLCLLATGRGPISVMPNICEECSQNMIFYLTHRRVILYYSSHATT